MVGSWLWLELIVLSVFTVVYFYQSSPANVAAVRSEEVLGTAQKYNKGTRVWFISLIYPSGTPLDGGGSFDNYQPDKEKSGNVAIEIAFRY